MLFCSVFFTGISNAQQANSSPQATNDWFRVKECLTKILSNRSIVINSIETFEKLLGFCLAYRDVHGLTDCLQMMDDWNNSEKDTQLLPALLCEQILAQVCSKSPKAGLQLFPTLFEHAQKTYFTPMLL